MSEDLPDDPTVDPTWWAEHTQLMTEGYCPVCEPDVDPFGMVHVQYCHRVGHRPTDPGSMDWAVRADRFTLPVDPAEYL